MSPAPARVAAALGLAALIQLIFPLATAIAQPIPQTTDLIPYPVTSYRTSGIHRGHVAHPR